jgi:hypothetical protein
MAVDSFQGSWDPLDMDVLVNHSRQEVRIAWFSISNTILQPLCDKVGIHSRQCTISTREVWQAYANTCLVVSYCDDRGNDIGWFAPQARHRTLHDWSVLHGDEPTYQRPGKIIVSAYDSIKGKRIVVDGIHRAAVITRSNLTRKEQFPTTIVYEWSGPFLNMIFPCDFCHFYESEPRANIIQT